MAYLIIKAAISGVLIAFASEIARRYPGWGALVASLPLVSIVGMMWLWRDTQDLDRLGEHSAATFWFVLPSLPCFWSCRGYSSAVWDSGPRWRSDAY